MKSFLSRIDPNQTLEMIVNASKDYSTPALDKLMMENKIDPHQYLVGTVLRDVFASYRVTVIGNHELKMAVKKTLDTVIQDTLAESRAFMESYFRYSKAEAEHRVQVAKHKESLEKIEHKIKKFTKQGDIEKIQAKEKEYARREKSFQIAMGFIERSLERENPKSLVQQIQTLKFQVLRELNKTLNEIKEPDQTLRDLLLFMKDCSYIAAECAVNLVRRRPTVQTLEEDVEKPSTPKRGEHRNELFNERRATTQIADPEPQLQPESHTL